MTARRSSPSELGHLSQRYATISTVDSHVFWYGDNLTVMREHIPDESVDLIYLDPPFNSQRIYNRFFGEHDGSESDAQRKAFDDYWRWGPEAAQAYDEVVHPRRRRSIVPATLSQTMEMLRQIHPDSNLLAYLSMMAVRLVEMRRALKPTGSLYLHCDPTASHYLKLVMDSLFGSRNFRSEIVWKRTFAHGSARRWGDVHDILFFYSKGDAYAWNREGAVQEHASRYIEGKYRFEDERGRYRLVVLTGSGTRNGESGKPWRGYNPTAAGRHWAVPGDAIDLLREDGHEIPKGVHAKLELLLANGFIRFPEKAKGKQGVPEYKRYLTDGGTPIQDVVVDIPPINSQATERTNYPTQKPIALLERVIRASSNEGDVVLDPFCGCGTAVVAAQRLDRRWVGIDITHVAVSVLKNRLETEFPGLAYRVRGEPEDITSARRLAEDRWDEFQAWVVDKVGGIPLNPTEEKKVAKKGKDGGVDGILLFRDDPKAPSSHRMIISVKAGKSLAPSMVDELYGTVTRQNARAGVLLTAYKPTPGMLNTARAYGTYTSEMYARKQHFPVIQIVSVEDIFAPGWRHLDFPGANTSFKSQPPPRIDAEGNEVLKPRPTRKAAAPPPEQAALEFDRLEAPKPPKKATPARRAAPPKKSTRRAVAKGTSVNKKTASSGRRR